MDFEDKKKDKTQNGFNIQFQDNAYQQIFSQTGGSKSYESKSRFDEYSPSQYTDFSKTDHFFRDDQQEPKDPHKKQNNYENSSSLYTQNQITQPEKQNQLKPTKNSPQSTNRSNNQSHQQNSNPSQLKQTTTFTSRNILNLQLRRQQELKTLSEEDFIRSKEFQFFETEEDVNWKLSIADYYEKVVPDPEFNKWIKKTRRNSQYRVVAFWGMISGICYFYYAAKMNYLPNIFAKNAKLIPLIPIAGIYIMGYFEKQKDERAKEFFKHAQNQQIMKSLIRRYLCDASARQRLDVYWAK